MKQKQQDDYYDEEGNSSEDDREMEDANQVNKRSQFELPPPSGTTAKKIDQGQMSKMQIQTLQEVECGGGQMEKI